MSKPEHPYQRQLNLARKLLAAIDARLDVHEAVTRGDRKWGDVGDLERLNAALTNGMETIEL